MNIFNYKTKKQESVNTMFSPKGTPYEEDGKSLILTEDSNLVLIGEDINSFNAYTLEDLKAIVAACELEINSKKESIAVKQ